MDAFTSNGVEMNRSMERASHSLDVQDCVPHPSTESNIMSSREVYVSQPNVASTDVPVTNDDAVCQRVPEQVAFADVCVKLVDCSHLLDNTGVLKLDTFDQNCGDSQSTIDSEDYTNEVFNSSDDADTLYEPIHNRKDSRRKSKQKLHTRRQKLPSNHSNDGDKVLAGKIDALEKLFACALCEKAYVHLKSLRKHQRNVHEPKQLYKCPYCPEEFTTASFLKAHGKTHKINTECGECGKKFMWPSQLIQHKLTHTKERPCVCDLCGKTFKHQDDLNKHQIFHAEVKPHECTICSKTFFKKSSLTTHLQRHSGSKSFLCAHCSKTFATRGDLYSHEITHTKEKRHLCMVCGKKFLLKQSLIVHQRIHTGEKPFLCTYCSCAFSQRNQRDAHLRRHKGESVYKCSPCKKTFPCSKELKEHRQTHIVEKPFICSVCKKTFSRTDSFKVHMRLHTGEKPYTCETCGKKFNHKQTFWKHQKSKHGIERSYSCLLCKWTFSSYNEKRSHKCVQG